MQSFGARRLGTEGLYRARVFGKGSKLGCENSARTAAHTKIKLPREAIGEGISGES